MEFTKLLNDFKQLGIQEAINFKLMNETFISHHSTAIEGSTLSLDEVRILVKDGLTAKGKPLYDHEMVKDHQIALEWVVNEAKTHREITPQFIQEISAKVMSSTGGVISAAAGNYDSSKGEWRKSAVSAGQRYFINYLKVEREVIKLCNYILEQKKNLNSEIDIYNLAFDAHFYLLTIHPFADGNGRASRLLMNYILAERDQPLATIFKDDKADYYKALEDSRKGDEINLTPIRDFMFSQQEKFLSQEIGKFTQQDIDLKL